MHYEDLTLKEINKKEGSWYGIFSSENGGTFMYPLASSDLTEEDLIQNDIFVGKKYLGLITNEFLAALDGFSYINSNSKTK